MISLPLRTLILENILGKLNISKTAHSKIYNNLTKYKIHYQQMCQQLIHSEFRNDLSHKFKPKELKILLTPLTDEEIIMRTSPVVEKVKNHFEEISNSCTLNLVETQDRRLEKCEENVFKVFNEQPLLAPVYENIICPSELIETKNIQNVEGNKKNINLGTITV
ncbi:uncharacterized protein LOC131663046 [Phymastichus coffea]|uniref:uncharacterized protein LOC131663046 n=1 Tax=Phymastichus coffea TaxID=108790 RepID=UPI00273CE76F|nr:uncharacterized protein LOC131663046 [Phymastichus coffea]